MSLEKPEGATLSRILSIDSDPALSQAEGVYVQFFEICDYLNITPMEFFDLESEHPEKIHTLTEQLKRLDAAQLDSILRIVNGLVSNHPY